MLELEVGIEVVGNRGGRGTVFGRLGSGRCEFNETDAILIAFLPQPVGGYRNLVGFVSLGNQLFIDRLQISIFLDFTLGDQNAYSLSLLPLL